MIFIWTRAESYVTVVEMKDLWEYRDAVGLWISPTGWSRKAGIHTAPQAALPQGPWWWTDILSWYRLGSPAGQHHNNYCQMIPQLIRAQKRWARGLQNCWLRYSYFAMKAMHCWCYCIFLLKSLADIKYAPWIATLLNRAVCIELLWSEICWTDPLHVAEDDEEKDPEEDGDDSRPNQNHYFYIGLVIRAWQTKQAYN